MRDKILIAIMTFFSLTVAAQQHFTETYSLNNRSIGYSIIKVDNGYVIAGSSYIDNLKKKDIIVLKVANDGSVRWFKTIGGYNDEEAYEIKETSDKGFVLTGYSKSYAVTGTDSFNVYLAKLDSSGSVQWSKCYGGNSTDIGYSVYQTHDAGFIITGYTKSFSSSMENVYVFKTNASGNLLWSKSIGSSGTDIGRSVIETSDHNFIIAGYTDGFNSQGNVVYVLKLDSVGNLRWSKKYDFSYSNTKLHFGFSVIESIDHKYIIAGGVGLNSFIGDGGALLLKTDTAGNKLWAHRYPLNSGYNKAYSVKQTPDGGYIMAGFMAVSTPALIKVNSNGIEEWNWLYAIPGSGNGFGYSATYTDSGGFIMTGYFKVASDTVIALVKTDSSGLGCQNSNSYYSTGDNPSCSVGVVSSTIIPGGISIDINSISENSVTYSVNQVCIVYNVDEIATQNDIIIYPNPAHDVIEIVLYKKSVVRIFNITGQLLKQINIDQKNASIDISGLSSGIYFLKVETSEGVSVKKIMKE